MCNNRMNRGLEVGEEGGGGERGGELEVGNCR